MTAVTSVPEVSVVIVNWNGKHLLADCLGSLTRQTFSGAEIIVVDNGSTDGSADWIAQHFPSVTVLALPENEGFCGGNNAGIRASRGRFVTLLNNDTEVESGWLDALYRHMCADETVAACDSKVFYFDRRNVLWAAGGTYAPSGATTMRGYGEVDAGQYEEPTDVFIAVACAAMYRRSVLDEIGLLDEYFFAGYEDVDWSFRAKLRGYRIMNVPAAQVYHKVSATHGYNSETYVYRGQRNVEAVYFKNMPTSLMWRYGVLHVVYVLGSAVYFARVGRFRAFLRAKMHIIRDMGQLAKSRRQIQASTVITSSALYDSFDRGWWGAKIRKLIG